MIGTPFPTPQEAKAHPVLWAMYASRGVWAPAAHLWYLADYLLKVERGEITRLCISWPPQHGKSWLTSRYFPGWLLGQHPDARILQCSYGQELTVEWTGHGRDSIAAHGPTVFGIDTWSRARRSSWDIYRGGHRTGGGVRGVGKGGTVGGRPADYAILDDLVKDRAEANNASLRQLLWEWLESVVFPRVRRLIIIATRWHEDDVIGRLEKLQAEGRVGEPWTFVNIPAVAEPDQVDPLGRAPGVGLWPERYPGDWYDKKRVEVGGYVWSSLYQGRPSPVGGGFFKREWFKYYDLVGTEAVIVDGERIAVESLRRFATCDLSTSARTDGDWTAIAVWGSHVPTGRLFLLDMIRGHPSPAELVRTLRGVVDRWPIPVVYVERAGYQLSALSLITAAQREGLPVREIHPDGDKVTRALPATAALEGRRVLMPRGQKWMPALEDELLAFPAGSHDDQVDAFAYGVIVAAGLRRRASGNDVKRFNSDDIEGGSWTIGR